MKELTNNILKNLEGKTIRVVLVGRGFETERAFQGVVFNFDREDLGIYDEVTGDQISISEIDFISYSYQTEGKRPMVYRYKFNNF
jgi:hypothetical protein